MAGIRDLRFFLILTSIMGNGKLGGSNNTLSYSAYFFLIAATFAFMENRPSDGRPQRTLVLIGTICLLIQIPSVYVRHYQYQGKEDFAGTAYRYMKNHPGISYFPRLNVLHLLAERKNYHASVALMDRDWAKMPVQSGHFLAHIPPRLEIVAFAEGRNDDRQWIALPDLQGPLTDPELPGFRIYRKQPSSS